MTNWEQTGDGSVQLSVDDALDAALDCAAAYVAARAGRSA